MADTAATVGTDPETPISRVLGAGARGAERMAHATGVDRAVNQAVEEAIARALRSPAVIRAIERAFESDEGTAERDAEMARLVKRVLASDAADRAWAEVLQSDQTQKLVERIAGAPEIRAAIASQGAGLITDIGVRLTVITEHFDDALERVTRRHDPDSETDQAGLAIFGEHLSLVAILILTVLGLIVGGGTFALFWSLGGQTPGMRFLAIRLIHHDARDLTFGQAVRRVIAVILSLIPLGLGYLAILRDPQRRAWADRMTETAVIFDTVARSAPHAGATPAPAATARHRSGDTG
jgi:uncharacterized RDD family membrane protein YckC